MIDRIVALRATPAIPLLLLKQAAIVPDTQRSIRPDSIRNHSEPFPFSLQTDSFSWPCRWRRSHLTAL